ncbi:MAG: hypothetical protein Q4F69_05640, partial [Bacteroidia bacterium]|nr:hypothetical protein [Bacteroidia bacterium]
GQAWEYVCGMMQFGTLKAGYRFFLPNRLLCWPTNLFIIIMFVVEWVSRNKQHGLGMLNGKNKIINWAFYVIISMLVFWYYQDNNAFIYFQF